MANIDYQGARKEIVQIFENAGSERKVVFWYDAPANFKDDITSDSYDCCRVLVCNKNEFAIKKIIEHEDTGSNFLVYIPEEKPADSENWLLDILMYSEEYYADTVALTMRRLGLTNTDLRRVIERYAKFFDAESRTKKLGTYVEISDKIKCIIIDVGIICSHSSFGIRYSNLQKSSDIIHTQRLELKYHRAAYKSAIYLKVRILGRCTDQCYGSVLNKWK